MFDYIRGLFLLITNWDMVKDMPEAQPLLASLAQLQETLGRTWELIVSIGDPARQVISVFARLFGMLFGIEI